MNESLLDILVDPISAEPLTLNATKQAEDGDILEGTLCAGNKRVYDIHNGIPRFVITTDGKQKQTEASFGYKWQREETYASAQSMKVYAKWLVEKYGFRDLKDMQHHFSTKTRILDAECGSGYSASVWVDDGWRAKSSASWIGIDISEAIDVAKKRLGPSERTQFIQGDVIEPPFKAESFDANFSEGVLHHTPSTERALKSLARLLAKEGEFMFYVYRRKGAIREFADDYIRDLVADMPPDQAWEMLEPLTKLGEALANLRATVDVPEDVPYLGIRAGQYDVQRLIYWHFLKLFWNEQYSFEENQHDNFDWYHPRYAHRQSKEEVRRWCEEAQLSVTHLNVQESGITVRAVKY